MASGAFTKLVDNASVEGFCLFFYKGIIIIRRKVIPQVPSNRSKNLFKCKCSPLFLLSILYVYIYSFPFSSFLNTTCCFVAQRKAAQRLYTPRRLWCIRIIIIILARHNCWRSIPCQATTCHPLPLWYIFSPPFPHCCGGLQQQGFLGALLHCCRVAPFVIVR